MTRPRELIDLTGLVFLRKELIGAGYTDRQIRTLLKTKEFHRIRHGSYCLTVVWDSLSAADRHRLHARAVLKRAHPSTVLTHISAAIEHGAPVWGFDLGKVHTTRTDGRASRLEKDRVQHAGVLPKGHVEILNDVRVSSPTRCAVEVTTIGSVERAMVSVDGLLASDKTTLEAVALLAHDTRYWPNSLRTTVVLRLADKRHESAGESRTAYFCFAQQLPKPEPQVVILDEDGREFARVDFAWIKLGVFLEFDGKVKYEKYRAPGETLDAFLMREKEREEKICQLTGWVCLRITWQDLASPELLARRIRKVLDSRVKGSV